jgi:hypothetical protein
MSEDEFESPSEDSDLLSEDEWETEFRMGNFSWQYNDYYTNNTKPYDGYDNKLLYWDRNSDALQLFEDLGFYLLIANSNQIGAQKRPDLDRMMMHVLDCLTAIVQVQKDGKSFQEGRHKTEGTIFWDAVTRITDVATGKRKWSRLEDECEASSLPMLAFPAPRYVRRSPPGTKLHRASWFPLHWAVSSPNLPLDVVERALEVRNLHCEALIPMCEISLRGFRYSVAHYAAASNGPHAHEVVKLIHQISPRIAHEREYLGPSCIAPYPLHLAAKFSNNAAVCKYLHELNPSAIDSPTGYFIETAEYPVGIAAAAVTCSSSVFRFLFENAAKPFLVSQRGSENLFQYLSRHPYIRTADDERILQEKWECCMSHPEYSTRIMDGDHSYLCSLMLICNVFRPHLPAKLVEMVADETPLLFWKLGDELGPRSPLDALCERFVSDRVGTDESAVKLLDYFLRVQPTAAGIASSRKGYPLHIIVTAYQSINRDRSGDPYRAEAIRKVYAAYEDAIRFDGVTATATTAGRHRQPSSVSLPLHSALAYPDTPSDIIEFLYNAYPAAVEVCHGDGSSSALTSALRSRNVKNIQLVYNWNPAAVATITPHLVHSVLDGCNFSDTKLARYENDFMGTIRFILRHVPMQTIRDAYDLGISLDGWPNSAKLLLLRAMPEIDPPLLRRLNFLERRVALRLLTAPIPVPALEEVQTQEYGKAEERGHGTTRTSLCIDGSLNAWWRLRRQEHMSLLRHIVTFI